MVRNSLFNEMTQGWEKFDPQDRSRWPSSWGPDDSQKGPDDSQELETPSTGSERARIGVQGHFWRVQGHFWRVQGHFWGSKVTSGGSISQKLGQISSIIEKKRNIRDYFDGLMKFHDYLKKVTKKVKNRGSKSPLNVASQSWTPESGLRPKKSDFFSIIGQIFRIFRRIDTYFVRLTLLEGPRSLLEGPDRKSVV